MVRLFGYLRRYRHRLAAGAACLLLTATLVMLVPYLLKRGVEAVERGQPLADVARFAALIVVAASVQGVVRTFSRALIFNVGRDVEYDLRNDLFAHLLRLPCAYYQGQQTGDLMSRLINDVTAVRMLLGPGVLNLLNTPLYYAYALSIMLSLDPRLTLVALLPFPVLLGVVKGVSRRLMEQTSLVQEGLASMSALVQENLSGIHVVKAFDAERLAVSRFSNLNADFTRESLALARVRGRLFPLMKVTAGLGTLLVLTYGGGRVMRGETSLGDLVAFIGYLNILAWPTMAMGWMLSILQRGRAALRRLEQVLAVAPEIRDREGVRPLGRVSGRVEYHDVSFCYPGSDASRPVVEGVSFVLEPGQKLAVVGRTGAGKSTLAQLLVRLFDVTGGRISIDGRDIRDIPLAQLRRSVAFVPQDPLLFSATVRANIEFGMEDPDEDLMRRAAETAAVAPDIEALPRGYDTLVGERGITLSGGQKQRLTLARAVAARAPILVLDDALSSVDARTEREILHRLRTTQRETTCILIAHRLSTVIDADRIAVVEDGRIVEFGDHASLLARDGLYAETFRRQQIEREIEER